MGRLNDLVHSHHQALDVFKYKFKMDQEGSHSSDTTKK